MRSLVVSETRSSPSSMSRSRARRPPLGPAASCEIHLIVVGDRIDPAGVSDRRGEVLADFGLRSLPPGEDDLEEPEAGALATRAGSIRDPSRSSWAGITMTCFSRN